MTAQYVVGLRTADDASTYPERKSGYVCALCGEGVTLWPVGQRMARGGGLKVMCLVCFRREAIAGRAIGVKTPEVRRADASYAAWKERN